jgi:hypothetical protein
MFGHNRTLQCQYLYWGRRDMRRQAWFAIIICILALVPGLIAGAVAAYIYRLTTAWHIGYDPDWMMLRTIFGIEWPGMIVQWIFFSAFPSFVHGLVAGGVATWITAYVCKGAPFETAAYSTGTLVTGLFGVSVILVFVIGGPIPPSIVEATIQIVGMWAGLITALGSVPSTPQMQPAE